MMFTVVSLHWQSEAKMKDNNIIYCYSIKMQLHVKMNRKHLGIQNKKVIHGANVKRPPKAEVISGGNMNVSYAIRQQPDSAMASYHDEVIQPLKHERFDITNRKKGSKNIRLVF